MNVLDLAWKSGLLVLQNTNSSLDKSQQDGYAPKPFRHYRHGAGVHTVRYSHADPDVKLKPTPLVKSYDFSWTYHIKTIWLFTYSDLKTIVGPKSVFGILHAFCITLFDESYGNNVSGTDVIRRIPLVVLWVWINLLPFAINNQRQPEGILEDRINKPWRPMPSGRLSPRTAKHLMFLFYGLAFVVSLALGGLSQHLALIALGSWYNDLGGADVSCVTRNLINGLGFISFGSGAMDVALGGNLRWTRALTHWLALIATIVATSVQTQDMYDQEGDSQRGRWTVPLSIGDGPARWTIAAIVPFWSLVAPAFWALPPRLWSASIVLGIIVAVRTLSRRTVSQDKATFRIWNLWVVCTYALPMVKLLHMQIVS